MLAVVVVVFAVLWLPYRVYVVYNSFASQRFEDLWVLLVCRVMVYTNSAINPLLYNIMSSNFRRAFVHLLPCKISETARRHLRGIGVKERGAVAERTVVAGEYVDPYYYWQESHATWGRGDVRQHPTTNGDGAVTQHTGAVTQPTGAVTQPLGTQCVELLNSDVTGELDGGSSKHPSLSVIIEEGVY